MNTGHLPIRLFQALILIAVLRAAAVTPLAGQQAPDSARVATASAAPMSSVQARSPNTGTLGPRLSPQFQRLEPRLAPSRAAPGPLAVAGGQHVIVLSTLALVIAVVIITLLVVK